MCGFRQVFIDNYIINMFITIIVGLIKQEMQSYNLECVIESEACNIRKILKKLFNK